MKRIAASAVVAALAIAALCSPAAGAAQAGSAPAIKHCPGTYFAPLYTHIKKISAQGVGCSAARELSLAYERATTNSFGPGGGHTGHCFGAHSYGECKVQLKGKEWDCFHFNATPAKTRGLVRCTADEAVIKFNIGV
jgi:hypothetical protein